MNAILVASCVWALATGAGSALSVRLARGRWSRAEALLLGSGLGLGFLAYLAWIIGLAGALNRTVLLALGLVLTPLALLGWRNLWRYPVGEAPPKAPITPRWLAVVFLMLLVSVSILPFIDCFVPPAAHEWDSLSYHLAVPKAYLREGRVIELPTDHHSYFPFLTQMLFTIALAFDGFAAAKLMHWAFGVLACATTYRLARRLLPPTGAWLGALVFGVTPVVVWEAGIAYIELAQAFYVVLAFLCLAALYDDRHPASAASLGLSLGFALAVKTLSLVPATAAIVLGIVVCGSMRAALPILGLAIVVGTPFYLRTWLLTGNPVYPFAYSVFGGKNWDAERARLYAGEHTSFGLDARLPALSDDLRPIRAPYAEPSAADRIRNLALAPFSLVATPRLFHNYNDPSPYMNLGFLWLAFVPLAVLRRPPDPRVSALLLAMAFWYGTWAFSMQYARYLIPALPLLAVIGSWGVTGLVRRSRALLTTAAAAIGIQIIVLAAHALPRMVAQARLAGSPAASEEFIARQVNVYRSQQWLNANTLPQEGVVLFEETRGFYLERPVLWGNAPHSAYIPYQNFRTGHDMAAWFAREGFPYAIVNLQFAPQAATPEGAQLLREAIRAGTESALLLRWYDQAETGDHWRGLIGDAVRTGAAQPLPQASGRGAVVLRFVTAEEPRP